VLVASLVITVVCPPQWQPWAQLAAAALVACAITVRHRGLPLLSRPDRPRATAVDVVDLISPDRSLVGCVDGGRLVTTSVEVTAGSLVCAEVGRDDPAVFQGFRLPLGIVARALDQGGVLLEGIDVVAHGRRASTGPDGEVYDSLVGPLPLISHRRVHLLLRFDLERLALTTAPGAAGSFQEVVAVATERLRRSLIHHGVPCRVLDAAELAERYLEAESEPAPGVGLVVRPGVDAREVIDALAAVRASDITEVVRIRRVEGRDDVVDVVSTVGLTGVGGDVPDVSASCHPLPSPRVLPVPGEPLPASAAGALVRRRVALLDALSPPANGSGQILGATRSGSAATLQLAGPHLRSVLLAARPTLCRQVAFRAVAAGYRVAVVTDLPERWRPLLGIGDARRLRIVDPDASDAGASVDAVFWDVDSPLSEGRIDAFAGPGGPDVTPPTVIRVDADWGVRHGTDVGPDPGIHHGASGAGGTPPVAPPDLVLDGRIEGWISVEPRGGQAFRVSVVSGPGEEVFVGPLTGPGELTPSGAAPSATPGRR
jgi:type VII secretion protein EccE